MNYAEFNEKIFKLRSESTKVGFTDKSKIEKNFLDKYSSLVSGSESVTEYGSGVPILSLYLLHQKKISKIIAIDNDEDVLIELEHIVRKLGLNVEIINDNVEKMNTFPNSDIGIGINSLYGFAPTYLEGVSNLQAHELTTIEASIIEKTNHSAFAIFRFLNGNFEWTEKEFAKMEMEDQYSKVEQNSKRLFETTRGVALSQGLKVKLGRKEISGNMHYVIGTERKG